MHVAEIVLKYVQVLVWPAVVAGIVVVFRAQIRELTQRILSVSAGGVEAKFDQAVSDAARVAVAGSDAADSVLKTPGASAADSRDRSIRSFRPKVYNDIRQFADAYRDGHAVTIDVKSASDRDGARMVDFAAGLIFSAHGNIQRVADRVFLLEQPKGPSK